MNPVYRSDFDGQRGLERVGIGEGFRIAGYSVSSSFDASVGESSHVDRRAHQGEIYFLPPILEVFGMLSGGLRSR